MSLTERKAGGTSPDADDYNAVVDAVVVLQAASGGGAQPITSPLGIDDCVAWYDASTLALANNAPVTVWPDLSGNGYDAAQATAENQPSYKTAVQNGLGVVRFASTVLAAQYLSFSGDALAMLVEGDGVTVAAAANYSYDDSVASGVLVLARRAALYLGYSSGSARADLAAQASDDDNAIAVENEVTQGVAAFSTPLAVVMAADFAAHSISGQFSTGGSMPAGSTQGTLATMAAAESGIIGGDAVFLGAAVIGDLYEIAVYNRALNAAERREVVEYLSAKWATL